MKKTFGVLDIVWINITVIFGLRWLPVAASYGASALILWCFAALLFFLPLSFISAELATTWPEQGGLYVWVKKAFGEKCAFLTSWFYWVYSFAYMPSLLTFVAICLAYVINPDLAKNKYYIASVILGCFWGITFLNAGGVRRIKFLPELSGSIGTMLPALLIIGLGFASAFILKHPIPTDYSAHNWIPHLGSGSNISFLLMLMFSMTGIELSPTLAGDTRDPAKTFPRAIIITVIIIVSMYIIGTLAINFILPPNQVSPSTGILDAISLISKQLNIPYLIVIFAITINIGNLGAISMWVLGPITMLFESTKGGILPPFLTKLNKNNAPTNIMYLQATIISVVTISALIFFPTVNAFYETLILLATIIYFLPYLFMFLAFLSLRKTHPHVTRPYRVPGGIVTARIISATGVLSVVATIIFSFLMPPSDIHSARDILFYRLEIGVPPIVLWLIGSLLFRNYERKKKLVAPQPSPSN